MSQPSIAIIDKCFTTASGIYYNLKEYGETEFGKIADYNMEGFKDTFSLDFDTLPNIVMLDVSLPDEQFKKIAESMLTVAPITSVLATYSKGEESLLDEALKYGAIGVYNKDEINHRVTEVLREVKCTGMYLPDGLTEDQYSVIAKNRYKQYKWNDFEDGHPDCFPLKQKEFVGLILYFNGSDMYNQYRQKAIRRLKLKGNGGLMFEALKNKWLYGGSGIVIN